jgi:predicted DNA-binding transcriptional regulator AlpA
MNDIELLHVKKVLRLVPVSRRTLFRWIAKGVFPEPVLPNLWRKDQIQQAISMAFSTKEGGTGQNVTPTNGLTLDEKES